jgi:hypothetical protein
VDAAVWILCACAAAFGAWALHVGWHHSILDLHPWRQSHTAISAYEMVRGGPFWRYVTPILGPPWPSPIEMPLYQWIVAVASRSQSTGLHETGRAVSVAFFLGTLVSYWFALDILIVQPRYRPVFIALAMASPLFLFWSRTFMIESTALFFAVTFLLAVHRATKPDATTRAEAGWWIAAAAAGVLGGMVKVTTFVPWWTGAALLVAVRWWRAPLPRPRPALAAAGLILPVVAAAGWLAFSGAVKTANPLSARLAWSTVAWQHFGPLAMRVDPRSWYSVPGSTILGRTRHTVLASGAVFAAAWLAIVLFRRRLTPLLVCVGLYFLPIAIFMHLYTAHVYYSYANALLLVTMAGCGMVALLERRDLLSWLGFGLLTWALAAMTSNYLAGYYVDQQSDDVSRWPLASLLERQVPAGEVLLIYGVDLDPEFTYMAGHRAIQSWEDRGAGDPLFERSLQLLASEGGRIGALVACGESRGKEVIAKTVERLSLADRPSSRDSYCDVYFPRDRRPAVSIAFR